MVRFTDTYIKNLKSSDKRMELFEGDGFGIFVYPTGTKTWVYRYKIDGKKDHVSIGNYPSVSLADAKKQFMQLREIKRGGSNPKKIILTQEEESFTVKDLVTNWFDNYIKRHRKCPGQIEQIVMADIIPMLGNVEVEELKTKDITRSLDKIVNRGSPVHANKALSALKQAFNYAVSRGELTINHAANIRARDIGGVERPRERFLTLNEIKQLWLFLNNGKHGVSLQIVNAIKILLLTGVRTGELRIARWKEFDFENSLWTIPAANTKTGTTMRVHLTEPVKSLFMELYHCNIGDYVISGADGLNTISDRALPKAVNRLQERVGIPKWTAHDLRRTFATQLGETLNIDPVVIEKCLGHKMPKIMATYNKNEMLPQKKDALEKWSSHIVNLVSENVALSRLERITLENV